MSTISREWGIYEEQVMDFNLAFVDTGDVVAIVLVFFDGYDDKVDDHFKIAKPILTSVTVVR